MARMKKKTAAAPTWPIIAASAAAGAAAGLVVVGNFFSGGKRVRHPITCPYSVGDESFVRSVSQLLGPPLLKGNRVTALQNGSQIFPAMIEAIRSARHTITFENYIFWKGSVTRSFAGALAERARAGVRVHLLQDALGCDCVHGQEMRHMRNAGVEVELYRFFHITRINERTHRKLLIVDGKVGFIGGAGIGDPWDGFGDKPAQWRDSHYRLAGPAVAQMQQAFMDHWLQTRAELLHGEGYFPDILDAGDNLCQVFKSSSEEGSDSARILFLISIAAARKTLRIANAYFVPDTLLLRTLVEAARRGVRVEIIVPGPLCNHRMVRWTSRTLWGSLLREGIRIYEFQPTNFHCKYMIADDQWVSVGSANLDNRSLRLNEECNLNVLDQRFATEHIEVFEADKRNSIEVTFDDWKARELKGRIAGLLGRMVRSQL
jgi:cardiolipin synthase